MSRRWGRLGECATLSPLGQLNAADLACGSGGVRLIGPADKVELATRERGPRMYEMQGPRLVDQRKLADCPGEWSAGAIGEPHALVVLPPVQDTRKSPGCPVLSRSPSRLWVVPVFAGREVSTPNLRGAQDLPRINFKILLLSTGLSTERAHFSTELEVIHRRHPQLRRK